MNMERRTQPKVNTVYRAKAPVVEKSLSCKSSEACSMRAKQAGCRENEEDNEEDEVNVIPGRVVDMRR